MAQPKLLKGEWSIALPNKEPATLEGLGKIPGLRVHEGESTATGLIDAVASACRLIGIEAPSKPAPEAKQFSTLFPYQAAGVNRLLEITSRSGGALLADDVGLGKTRQALTYAAERKGRTFIVCPAYVRRTWADEIRKVLGEGIGIATRDVLATKFKQTHWETWATKAPFVITSYELAGTALKEAFSHTLPTTLIMDEAHYLCGRMSKRSRNLREVAALVPYKLALTATPAWNRPRDFYSLLSVLLGKRFGSPSDFDFRYCAGLINEFGGMVNRGVSNADELRLRLSYYMVRREKKEVLSELPPLTRQIVWVDADKKATSEFRRLNGLATLDKPNISKALEATHDGKLAVAQEMAVQARRFLLFTYRKSHARILQQRIEADGVPCVCITGDLSPDQRSALCAEAAREGKGVVATIDSAGAGLNLQGVAHTGIFHALDWLPNKLHQAEGRLHRIGQTNGVVWQYICMRESADELVARTVVEKMDNMRSILGGEAGMRNTLQDSLTLNPEQEANLLKEMYDAIN